MPTFGLAGALNAGFTIVTDWLPKSQVYLPEPVISIHERIALRSRVPKCHTYPYYDHSTNALNVPRMLDAMRAMPENSVVVLHASGHNPTGLDPTEGEWDCIMNICKEKQHLPFFLLGYQGIVSGSTDNDAYYIRKFMNEGLQLLVAQSYSVNMGIYGERAGAFHVACLDAQTAERTASQLRWQIRRFYSAPPLHPARVVGRLLENPEYCSLWQNSMRDVHARLTSVRKSLRDQLIEMQTPGNWDCLLRQGGLYSALGLSGIKDCV